ncbi:MAG: MFS transporter [Candidatus Micrarchaeia archaeon]
MVATANPFSSTKEKLIEHKKGNYTQSITLIIIMVGVTMAAIDTTVVVLALPTIDLSLKTNPIASIWTILAYILILTVISSQVGKIGDRYGRVKLYNYGLIIFVIGSAMAGISPNIAFLIFARAFQAIGGALLGTMSSAVISDHFEPHERGKAFGYTGIGWNFGAILGIFIGGFLATVDWRLIFYINVPIGLVIIPIALYKLHDISKPKEEPIDILGASLLGVGLLLLVLGSTFSMYEGITYKELLMFFVSAVIISMYLLRERKIKYPTINFELFKNRVFNFSVAAATLQSTASYAILFIIILYLQGIRGLNPFVSSLYLLPGYLIGGLIAPVMGRVSDKVGARLPATLGLIFIATGYAMYIMFLGVDTPLYYIALITVLTGIGSGAFFPSNSSAIMANAPKERYAMASGLNRMLNNIGMVLSFAIALTVASASVPRNTAMAIFSGSNIKLSAAEGASFLHGIDSAFMAAIIIILIAAVLSAVRGKENRMQITKDNASKEFSK